MKEDAKEFAIRAHWGQRDKAGAPYYEHLCFVADAMESDVEKCVAYLHDTLEDTETDANELRKLFGDEITDAVLAMTKGEDEDYMEYIERVRKNPLASKVKRADLTHNMMLGRLKNPTVKDCERVERYRKAFALLSQD